MSLPASLASLAFACCLALAAAPARAQAPAGPPPPCADSDLAATDSATLSRQLGPECSHVESVRAWHEAWRHYLGYEGYRIDWPAALAAFRRSAEISKGHAPGTMGRRRWLHSNQEAAFLLFYGGRGVQRDLAQARRMIAESGNDPASVAMMDRAIAAEAEATRPPPTPVAVPGLWQTRISKPGRDAVEDDPHCEDAEALSVVMEVEPEGDGCAWLELSRSPTRVDARWACRMLETFQNRTYFFVEETRIEIDLSADRVEMKRTEISGEQYGPKTTAVAEQGTAVRLGGC